MKKLLIIVAVLVFGMAANAQAVSFDLTDSPSEAAFFVFEESGIEFTVTAERQTGAAILVTQNLSGLGARTDDADLPLLDSDGPNERLIFTITGLPVGVDGLILDSIFFNAFNESSEDFGIIIDDVDLLGNQFNPGADLWDLSNDLALGQRTVFNYFSIRATDAGGTENFRIGNICVTPYSSQANPVPEPSTMLLLGAGLVGLIAFGRKKLLP